MEVRAGRTVLGIEAGDDSLVELINSRRHHKLNTTEDGMLIEYRPAPLIVPARQPPPGLLDNPGSTLHGVAGPLQLTGKSPVLSFTGEITPPAAVGAEADPVVLTHDPLDTEIDTPTLSDIDLKGLPLNHPEPRHVELEEGGAHRLGEGAETYPVKEDLGGG